MISSYPKVWNTHRKEARYLLGGKCYAEEKVDGSNFGFGVIGGTLHCSSKTRPIDLDSPHGNFAPAVEYLKGVKYKLPEGYQFRAEFLKGPRQNKLVYGRTPRNHLVLFDAIDNEGMVVDREVLEWYADYLCIDITPVVWEGRLTNWDLLKPVLERESFLGKVPIEGVVIKNGSQCRAKVVADWFRETKAKVDKSKEGIAQIVDALSTPARWAKVCQVGDEEELIGGPEDFSKLLPRLNKDLDQEEEDFIKQELYQLYRKKIMQGVTHNFKQHYLCGTTAGLTPLASED